MTLGLAVSAGGLLMPVLGVIADAHGPGAALTALAIVPVVALALSSGLREPGRRRHPQVPATGRVQETSAQITHT